MRWAAHAEASSHALACEVQSLRAALHALQQRNELMQSSHAQQLSSLERRAAFLAAEWKKCICSTQGCAAPPLSEPATVHTDPPDGALDCASWPTARSMLSSAHAVHRANMRLLEHSCNALRADIDPAAAAERMLSKPKAVELLSVLLAQHSMCVTLALCCLTVDGARAFRMPDHTHFQTSRVAAAALPWLCTSRVRW